MIQRSPDSQKAMWATIRKRQLQYLPVQGSRSRARRNRYLLTGVGLLGTGGALAYYTRAGERMGPFSFLTGATGQGATPHRSVMVNGHRRPISFEDRVGTYHAGGRVPTKGEAIVARTLLSVAPKTARKIGIQDRNDVGREIYRRYIAEPNETVAQSLRRNRYMWLVKRPSRFELLVPTVPVDAQIKPALRKGLAAKAEAASLWNLFGRGQLYDVLEQGSLRGQVVARKKAQQLVNALARRVEKPVGKAVARLTYQPLLKADRALRGVLKRWGLKLIKHGARRAL